MIRLFVARVRRYVGDLVRHLFWGTLCHLRGRHLKLALVSKISKDGFRGIPFYQCRRCLAFHITDVDALKFGGRKS